MLKHLSFLPVVWLAMFASPAAAHDSTLAFVEAIEVHLRDCPSFNGYLANGEPLRHGFEEREESDPVLDRAARFFTNVVGISGHNVNIFTKTVEGHEIIQFMAMRQSLEDDAPADAPPNDPRSIKEIGLYCVTIVPTLPFMPSGKLLEMAFGKEPVTGIENSPRTSMSSAYIWQDISPDHPNTRVSYNKLIRDMPPIDIVYNGFVIETYRNVTPENPELERD